jgi:hypothetical protein
MAPSEVSVAWKLIATCRLAPGITESGSNADKRNTKMTRFVLKQACPPWKVFEMASGRFAHLTDRYELQRGTRGHRITSRCKLTQHGESCTDSDLPTVYVTRALALRSGLNAASEGATRL